MTGRIDHVAAAKDWIENSVKAQAGSQPNNEQLAAAYAGIGQVHATLALVEQQRIANLIALGEARVAPGDVAPFRSLVFQPLGEYDLVPAEDVREGLGL